MKAKLILMAATVGVALAFPSGASAAPFAYVTNAGGGDGPPGNLSQYDATAGVLVPLTPAAVSTGNSPSSPPLNSPIGVAVTPDGKNVYVTAYPFAPTSGTLLHYAAAPDGTLTLKSAADLPPRALPGELAVSPDGRSLYAADAAGPSSIIQYSVGADGALSFKSPPTVPSDGAGRMAISPDGRNLYEIGPGMVSQYSIGAAGSLSPKSPPTVPTSERPSGVAVSPDSRSVYVAENEEFAVSGLVSQYTVRADGTLSPKSLPTVPAPGSPFAVVVSPNGESVYVTNEAPPSPAGTVLQYAVGGGGALTPMSPAAVAAGGGPLGIAVHPDGKSVYVADAKDGSVSQYTVGADGGLSAKSPAAVAAGNNPIEIAVSPLARVPTSKAQCKDGGWRNFSRFKNQGRCIAFVNQHR
jgi:DNA-binding beta-propeller fold protein YncE